MVNNGEPSFSRPSIKLQKSGVIAARRYWHTHCQKRSDGGQVVMKKGLVTIFCLLALTLSAIPAGAQTRSRYYDSSRRYEQRTRDYRYGNQVYGGRRYGWDRNRSFWDQHRDKLTTGIGAGAGAVL